jgi:hypothetical protein
MNQRALETDRRRHALRWIVLDTRAQLLAIGDAAYPGTSARTALDPTARRILLPEMQATISDGQARTTVVTAFGRRWVVRVRPLIGPVTGQPLAVLGCYGPVPGRFPPPPLIGCWEWEATAPGPDQRMRTYWSPSLYEVYGFDPPAQDGRHQGWWEVTQWLDELVAEADRPGMRRMLDELMTAPSDALVVHTFTAGNPETGQRHTLRAAGRNYAAEPGTTTWFRGVTMRVDHQSQPDAADAAGLRDYLDAVFALARDPLCGIDATYEHIYLTTAKFASLGVALPPNRYLPAMCHQDDLPALRQMLKQAVDQPNAPVDPVIARLAGVDGDWRRLEFTAVGVRRPEGEPRLVLCRAVGLNG